MGWSKGTDVFDSVVKEMIEGNILHSNMAHKIISALYNSLGDCDWDTFYESEYYDNPIVKAIIEKIDTYAYEEE